MLLGHILARGRGKGYFRAVSVLWTHSELFPAAPARYHYPLLLPKPGELYSYLRDKDFST